MVHHSLRFSLISSTRRPFDTQLTRNIPPYRQILFFVTLYLDSYSHIPGGSWNSQQPGLYKNKGSPNAVALDRLDDAVDNALCMLSGPDVVEAVVAELRGRQDLQLAHGLEVEGELGGDAAVLRAAVVDDVHLDELLAQLLLERPVDRAVERLDLVARQNARHCLVKLHQMPGNNCFFLYVVLYGSPRMRLRN